MSSPELYLRKKAEDWQQSAELMEKMGYVTQCKRCQLARKVKADDEFLSCPDCDGYGGHYDRPKKPVSEFTINVVHAKHGWIISDHDIQNGSDALVALLQRAKSSILGHKVLPKCFNFEFDHKKRRKSKKWQHYYLKITAGKKPIPCPHCNSGGQLDEDRFPAEPTCVNFGHCDGKRFLGLLLFTSKVAKEAGEPSFESTSTKIKLDLSNLQKLLPENEPLNEITIEVILRKYKAKFNGKTDFKKGVKDTSQKTINIAYQG